jgi:hypothetical protein
MLTSGLDTNILIIFWPTLWNSSSDTVRSHIREFPVSEMVMSLAQPEGGYLTIQWEYFVHGLEIQKRRLVFPQGLALTTFPEAL